MTVIFDMKSYRINRIISFWKTGHCSILGSLAFVYNALHYITDFILISYNLS